MNKIINTEGALTNWKEKYKQSGKLTTVLFLKNHIINKHMGKSHYSRHQRNANKMSVR